MSWPDSKRNANQSVCKAAQPVNLPQKAPYRSLLRKFQRFVLQLIPEAPNFPGSAPCLVER